jgi:type I restriction enzyme S subunit
MADDVHGGTNVAGAWMRRSDLGRVGGNAVSWPIGKVSNIADVISGFAFKSEWFGSGSSKVIRIGDLQDGRVDLEGAKTFDEAVHHIRDQFKIKNGDILMALSGATVGKIAVADALTEGAFLNQRVAIIRGRLPENTEYLKYIFSGELLQKLLLNAGGAAQPNLSPKDLVDMEIPLPPLAEQKRISAILDKADAIRRKRQQAIQLADDFLRAVFLDMFGELVTSSGYENSQKYKLLELVDYIDYRGKTPEKSDSGIPLITAKNVKCGYVDDNPREYIPEENYDAWMTRGFPRKNDVLFTTEAPLGNVALLGEYEKVAIGQRLVALRSKGKVTHEYLMFLLLHPFIQDLIYGRSSGSTVKGIRTKELYAIELPVPDMQKQIEFSAVYWKSKSLKINQESAYQLDELSFSALSQKAFRGEL